MPARIHPSIISAALAEEWRIAVNRLPQNEREALCMPLFSVLPELPGRWGQWRGGKMQCIELKEDLIRRHPWYAVVDVLRHEIAHQAVETLYPTIDESPHGQHFLQMCSMLGARPQASGDYPTLDEVIYSDQDDMQEEGATTPQSRLLLKIRKLLSLSESANENEARAALLKARELEAKFAQEFGEASQASTEESSFYTINIGPLLKRMTLKHSMLGTILQEFYHVRVVWASIPDIESKKSGEYCRQLCLNGSRKDLRIATYVYDCLSAYISRALYDLPGALLGKALTHAKVRQDFEIGVLSGFQAALREQNQRPEMRALVLCDKTRLEEYYHWAFPRLRTNRHTYTLHSQEARSAGEIAGRKFHIKQGLDSPQSKPRLLQ